MDQYSSVAPIYDLLYRDGLPGDLDWYAKELGDRPRRVLEIGCGTGRLSTELACRGHHVVGVDVSTSMLELAEARRVGTLRRMRGSLRLLHGEPSVALDESGFDFAIAPFNMLNECLSETEVADVLGSVGPVLKPGGRLLAHIVSYPPEVLCGPEGQLVRYRTRLLANDTGSERCAAMECDLFWPGQQRMERVIAVRVASTDGPGVGVCHYTIQRRYWTEQQLAGLLEQSGLEADPKYLAADPVEERSWHSRVAGVGSKTVRATRVSP